MNIVDKTCSSFLRTIILRMKELGVNRTELSKRMNVSRPYITKVLHGDVNFTFSTAIRFAQALEMDFFPELRARTADSVEVPVLEHC